MLVSTKMITGFNTDVRHDGNIYHVQTEDGGKDNPILESLVYVGGTIVAKKLTPYEPLKGDSGQDTLASLLKRQHQVIIAAIKAGRIEDLIRHSVKQQAGRDSQALEFREPASDSRPTETVNTMDRINAQAPPHATTTSSPRRAGISDKGGSSSHATTSSTKSGRSSERGAGESRVAAPTSSPRGDTAGLNLDQVLEDYVKRGGGQARLDVRVLAPDVFTAGKGIGLRVQVTQDDKPHFDATVTVKIIGTAFKPQVFIGRVGRDGVANFSLTLPSFSAGTAAIVIEAQSGGGRGELKKLIRRA
jgi:hypothetical protein